MPLRIERPGRKIDGRLCCGAAKEGRGEPPYCHFGRRVSGSVRPSGVLWRCCDVVFRGKSGGKKRSRVSPAALSCRKKRTAARCLPRVSPEVRLQSRYLFACSYSSAFCLMRAARFSLSGCEENICCTLDAFSPFDSSTSLFRPSAMP